MNTVFNAGTHGPLPAVPPVAGTEMLMMLSIVTVMMCLDARHSSE